MICMRPKNLFLRQIIFWPFHSFLIRKNLVEIFMVLYLVIRTDFGWEYEVPVCLQRLKINVSKLKSHFERCNERNIDIFIFIVWLKLLFFIWLKKLPEKYPESKSALLCSVRRTNLKFKPSAQPQPTQIQVQLIYDVLIRAGKLQNRAFVLSLA